MVPFVINQKRKTLTPRPLVVQPRQYRKQVSTLAAFLMVDVVAGLLAPVPMDIGLLWNY
jgi:hypothetical protein